MKGEGLDEGIVGYIYMCIVSMGDPRLDLSMYVRPIRLSVTSA